MHSLFGIHDCATTDVSSIFIHKDRYQGHSWDDSSDKFGNISWAKGDLKGGLWTNSWVFLRSLLHSGALNYPKLFFFYAEK